jgi:hypothetical protein
MFSKLSRAVCARLSIVLRDHVSRSSCADDGYGPLSEGTGGSGLVRFYKSALLRSGAYGDARTQRHFGFLSHTKKYKGGQMF